MDYDSLWFVLGVPGGALMFAAATYFWLRYQAHLLDRPESNIQPGE